MDSFTVNIDHAKINRLVKKDIEERIEQEKDSIIRTVINTMFASPSSFFNKEGGVMYQILREQIEKIAIEEMANLNEERIRKDFKRFFDKSYEEHLPVAVERAARKAAYQSAEIAANKAGK